MCNFANLNVNKEFINPKTLNYEKNEVFPDGSCCHYAGIQRM